MFTNAAYTGPSGPGTAGMPAERGRSRNPMFTNNLQRIQAPAGQVRPECRLNQARAQP